MPPGFLAHCHRPWLCEFTLSLCLHLGIWLPFGITVSPLLPGRQDYLYFILASASISGSQRDPALHLPQGDVPELRVAEGGGCMPLEEAPGDFQTHALTKHSSCSVTQGPPTAQGLHVRTPEVKSESDRKPLERFNEDN